MIEKPRREKALPVAVRIDSTVVKVDVRYRPIWGCPMPDGVWLRSVQAAGVSPLVTFSVYGRRRRWNPAQGGMMFAGKLAAIAAAAGQQQRVYRPVELPSSQSHRLTLRFDAGVTGYAFNLRMSGTGDSGR